MHAREHARGKAGAESRETDRAGNTFSTYRLENNLPWKTIESTSQRYVAHNCGLTFDMHWDTTWAGPLMSAVRSASWDVVKPLR